MSKRKTSGGGFSSNNRNSISKKETRDGSKSIEVKKLQATKLMEKGLIDEAESICKQLIKAGENDAKVYLDLLLILDARNRLGELIETLHQAILVHPENATFCHMLGSAFKEKGKLTEAASWYKKSLAIDSDQSGILYILGNTQLEIGDTHSAIVSYERSIELNTNQPYALYNLGIARTESGDPSGAISCFRRAISLLPTHAESYNNLGNAQLLCGEIDAAIESLKSAIQLRPSFAEAHNNMGNALHENGQTSAAISCYKEAIASNPDYGDAHHNLGAALMEEGKIHEAIISYTTALRYMPNCPETENGLGDAYHAQGNTQQAIASYERALTLNPNYPDAHANFAQCLLACGDYKRGWIEYEWRHQRQKPSLPHAVPRCRRCTDLAKDNIDNLIIVSEQGLGDTIQFMRYLKPLASYGFDFSFCAQPKLHELIQTSGINSSPITPEQANTLTKGFWTPLLSLPRLLGVSPDNPIVNQPYIKSTSKLIEKWQKILANEDRPIIAINWQGNPENERTQSIGRSIPLEVFSAISSQTSAKLLSIQKGHGSEQLLHCSFRDKFVRCQKEVDEAWNFLETAAIIECSDLVVTSDTSAAHLAAGLGKETWLLLKKVPEWRWGLEGEFTFWYPSMRLFRQQEQGGWAEVLDRVAKEIQKRFPQCSVINNT